MLLFVIGLVIGIMVGAVAAIVLMSAGFADSVLRGLGW